MYIKKTACGLFVVTLAAALSACGGGSGGSDSGSSSSSSSSSSSGSGSSSSSGSGSSSGGTAPTASVRFPLSGSWTTGATIGVRGTASDAEADEIVSVSVNGVPALTDDGFATWRVPDLAVQAGANTLEGLVRDAQGNVGTFSLVIEQGESPGTVLVFPGGMAFDPNNGRPRLLVPDRAVDALLAVDLSEGPGRGHRSIISQHKSGDEDRFLVPMAVALDAGNDRALVVDGGSFSKAGKLFAVDLASGERETLLEGLKTPESIAVDSDGNRVLLGDVGAGAIFAVNLSVTPPSIDPVVDVPSPVSIDFDPRNTNRALVVASEQNTKALFKVDIAGKSKAEVAGFANPKAVAFYPGDSTQALVVDSIGPLFEINPSALFEVDLDNDKGAKSLLSGLDASDGSIKGLGPRFISDYLNTSVVFDPADSDRVYAHGGLVSSRILSVDLATGDRIVLERSLGDGPEFIEPAQVALIPGASPDQPPMAVVLDKNSAPSDSIYRVNLAAGDNLGDRVVLSGFDADNPNQPRGSGVGFLDPVDMVVDADNKRLLVVENSSSRLMAVDLETGERTIFSDNDERGDGPEFCNLTGIALDPEKANKRALVTSCGALLAVDLDSGDRSILSGVNAGSGPPFPGEGHTNAPLALAANNRVLVVVDEDEEVSLMAVNLETGKRTVISNKILGSGPEIRVPESLSFDAVGNRALILDSSRNSIVAVDLDTGDRSIMSGIGPGPDHQFGGGDDELVGGGAAFNEWAKLSDAVLDADRQVLYVTDRAAGSLIAVDLATGDRVLVSGFAF